MEQFTLPKGWTGVKSTPRWTKPYGMCFTKEKRIEIYPPKWAPRFLGIREYLALLTWNHEVLHAYGSKGCKHCYCLEFESNKTFEYLAMLVQFLYGLEFCNDCVEFYNKQQVR